MSLFLLYCRNMKLKIGDVYLESINDPIKHARYVSRINRDSIDLMYTNNSVNYDMSLNFLDKDIYIGNIFDHPMLRLIFFDHPMLRLIFEFKTL